MFGEHRNMEEYIRSLEKLETMTADFDEIWPSHADIPIRPDCIRKLHDGAEKILNHEISGHEADFFGQKIMVYNLGFTTLLSNPWESVH